MTRAGRKTKRLKSAKAAKSDKGALFLQLLKSRLANPDLRSHAEFLHDMRTKRLSNPATAALLERLERAIK